VIPNLSKIPAPCGQKRETAPGIRAAPAASIGRGSCWRSPGCSSHPLEYQICPEPEQHLVVEQIATRRREWSRLAAAARLLISPGMWLIAAVVAGVFVAALL